MRIDSLQLIKYGKFTDRTLAFPAAGPDFHLVLGPNEAGKSTLRLAIVEALFGIATRSPLNFLHPLPELRLGATLSCAGQTLHFHRTKAASKTLRRPDNEVLPDQALQPFLGSADPHFFEQMFGLDHARLIAGGKSILDEKDQIGQMLFQAAAGMADLGRARDQMRENAQKLWAPTKSREREYYQAQQQFEDAGRELKALAVSTKSWSQLQANLARLQEQLTALRAQQQQAVQQQARLERVRRLAPHWHRLNEAQQALQTLHAAGAVVPLDADAGPILRQAEQQLAQSAPLLAHHESEIARLEQLLAHNPPDSAVLQQAGAIDALAALQQQVARHESDIALRQAEIATLWQQTQAACQQLGWPCESDAAVAARLPHLPLRRQLDDLARKESGLRQTHLAAQQALLAKQGEIESVQQALRSLQPLPSLASSARGDPVAPDDSAHPGNGSHPANPDNLPTVPTLSALQTALAKAQALGDGDAVSARQQQALRQAQSTLEQALAALGPWQKNVAELRAMLVPDAAGLALWAQELARLQDQHKTCRQRLHDKADELARFEAEISHIQARFHPTTHQAVLAARLERDQQWQAIKTGAAPLTQAAAGFEQAMLRADQLGDAHLAHAEQANALQSKQEQWQQAQQQHGRLAEAGQQAQAQQDEFAARWAAWCERLGLPGLPHDQIHGYLTRREQVLAAAEALAQEQAHQAQWQTRLAEVQTQLRQALAVWLPGLQSALPPDADLATLCQAAQRILRDHEANQARKSALQESLQAALGAQTRLQQQCSLAEAELAKWQQQWDAACVAAGMPAGSSAATVAGALELCTQIEEQHQQRQHIQQQRIEAMRADLQHFQHSAQDLAALLAPNRHTAAPEGETAVQAANRIARHLSERLQQARQAAQQAEQWQAALASHREQAQGLRRNRQQAEASLQPLLARVGVTSIALLAEAIARAEQQRHWQQQVEQCQQRLLADGDALPLERIGAEIAEYAGNGNGDGDRAGAMAAGDAGAGYASAADGDGNASGAGRAGGGAGLISEIARIGAELEQIRSQQDALIQQETEAKLALANIGGSDAALLAEAKRQEALSQMADVAERYIKAATAVHLLGWAINRYREEKQGPLLGRASELFATLSLGSFSRLIVNIDQTPLRLQGLRPDGKLVEISGMSDGTRDQLYLSLRLAALELHLQQATPLPFIADDLFINFDDARAAAGLRALARLAGQTQVIFLSHHEHLLPLVQQVLGSHVNVVRL